MKTRYQQFNAKRRLLKPDAPEMARLRMLSRRVVYGGNPEHKRNPGDFGLIPSAAPRLGKSLCDDIRIFNRALACDLLRAGLCHGLVSDRQVFEWPKNIWAVTGAGAPVEAQLENPVIGSYHGYPMPESDPLADEVIKQWKLNHA